MVQIRRDAGFGKASFVTALCCALLTLFSCTHEAPRYPGICLSFDDRTIKEWYGIREMLKVNEAKVTFFVTQFDSLDDGELRMLRKLRDDGHEIGSHGALHVSAEDYIKRYSYKAYLANEITPAISSMKKKGFDPQAFAYPYGSKYWFTDYLLRKNFKVLRGVAAIHKDRELASMDEAYFRFDGSRTMSAVGIDENSGLTRGMIVHAIQRAVERREVLLLYGHCPGNGNSGYYFDTALLAFILEQATKNNLRFYTASELIP
jgi:peptidoglycan/xylan/chitin deacetylase (PgdA/CDA1 family)